jgi:mRNA-degrading endonuclease RelE of RelBE toxin-antitoxin system
MAFRIEWKKSTRKDLRKLPASTAERIVETVKTWRKIPSRTAWKN